MLVYIFALIGHGPYQYTDHPLKHAACCLAFSLSLPENLCHINTPLKLDAWEKALAGHPDKSYVDYILQGIRDGFRVGFEYSCHACKQLHGNMLSTIENPEVVEDYLQKELSEGNIAKVANPSGLLGLQVSPFGVIPKQHVLNKWCLIVNLSSPKGSSVNDGISKELCSLSYVSVDTIAKQISLLGRGAMMVKMDMWSAYCLIPVHPCDRPLLSMRWKNHLFVDKALPFGLCSAPKSLMLWQMPLNGY